jgi:hypothetical protein
MMTNTVKFRRIGEASSTLIPGTENFFSHRAWLYVIVSYSQGFVYIGETASGNSLIQRLSEHFLDANSSLHLRLREVKKLRKSNGPFLILGYHLGPLNGIDIATSKEMRRLIEAEAHAGINNAAYAQGLSLISTCTFPSIAFQIDVSQYVNEILRDATQQIATHVQFIQTFAFKVVMSDVSCG